MTTGINKNTLCAAGLTILLSVSGSWITANEKTNENTKEIAVINDKMPNQEARYNQIIDKLDALQLDVNEVKIDVKLLKATKADRKYKD